MRKFLTALISTLFVLLSSSLRAESSTMVFEQAEHSFGTILEQDGAVSHVFKFTNTGSAPFVIENVASSCGCTTPQYPRQPIRPGQTGEITITYDPEGRPGRFSRDVIIVSNGRKNRNTLTVKGVVKERERSLEDVYPIEAVSGLRLSSTASNFSYVEQGQSRSMAIGYANNSDKTINISVTDVTGAPSFNVVAYPQSVAPGESGSLTLTYDVVDSNIWGYVSDKFYIAVDGQRFSTPITTTAIVVEKFDPTGNATNKKKNPSATIDPVYYDLGQLKNSSYTVRPIITNSGALPLVIHDIALPAGFSSSQSAPITIAPGASLELDITLEVAKLSQQYMESEIVLIVNEPARPMRKIRFIGYK